jgi:DNA-binding NarL/FixJ family response regulator
LERRILLVNIPQLMRDLIKAFLADEPGAEVVAEAATLGEGVRAAEAADADFVIVGTRDDALPAEYGRLLTNGNTRMSVLSVAGDGQRGFLHELKPQRVTLGPLTRETLLGAIKPRPEAAR